MKLYFSPVIREYAAIYTVQLRRNRVAYSHYSGRMFINSWNGWTDFEATRLIKANNGMEVDDFKEYMKELETQGYVEIESRFSFLKPKEPEFATLELNRPIIFNQITYHNQ